MHGILNVRRGSLFGCGIALALTVACGMAGWSGRLSPLLGATGTALATEPVRRVDLEVTVTAAGRVDSSERTIIECELEAMLGASWGSSTILSLVPEGTMVRKGDVLCTLDATHYDEALRLQEIQVSMVRSDLTKARLDLEVAKLAVVEYRRGLMEQTLTALKGGIALLRADHERAADRLQWARRMLQKGYLSRAQVATEASNTDHLAHSLKMGELELTVFERWSAPKYLKTLEAAVLMAESIFRYQSSRMTLSEQRLQFFREQVEACTIRAPHDGFLIYYTYPQYPTYRIQEGTVVLRTQKLFYLPDLNHMEVIAPLHETVVNDLQPGIEATIEVEGLPGKVLTGQLKTIPTMPKMLWYSDLRYFDSTVTLREVPSGLKPGMTASVKFLVKKPAALVIPVGSLAIYQGKEVCYVKQGNELQRREIKLGQSTPTLIEVLSGVEENEQVVLRPDRSLADLSL